MGTRSRRCRVLVAGRDLSGVRSGAHLALLELANHLALRPGIQVRRAALKGDRRTRHGHHIHIGRKMLRRLIGWADWVIVRDEPKTQRVLKYCRDVKIMYCGHSPAGAPEELGLELPRSALVVWASQALRDHVVAKHGEPTYRETVIEGNPLDLRPYQTPGGNRVTLVNLSERKGGSIFWRLAEAMPDTLFLGVRGWGTQVIPEKIPPNVKLLPRTPNPRDYYGDTRIILLPSAGQGEVEADALPAWTEAWNRVGVEAAASGIPAVATDIPGIRASLGDAAIYVDRDDFDGWVRAIRSLQEPGFHVERSRLAEARADWVQARFRSVMLQYERVLHGDGNVPGQVHPKRRRT